MFPKLKDWLPAAPYDPHYFFQAAWASRWLVRDGRTHVDVGSDVQWVATVSAARPIVFLDIRPLEVTVPGIHPLAADALSLPFADGSVHSLSALHVAEHVGLGRYGDALDPQGTRSFVRELGRVLAPGGALLLSLPIGRERVEFNAHRVHHPREVASWFADLELQDFCAVDDGGRFLANASLDDFDDASYACGMFRFVRHSG